MRISHLSAAALICGAALTATVARAAPVPAAQGLDAPQTGWLSPAQLKEKLGATEYSRTANIRRAGNSYRVDAIKDGTMHHLKVDPKTGDVIEDKTDKNP